MKWKVRGIYVWCEWRRIIVGNKGYTFQVSSDKLIVDIPEHSGPSSHILECVSADEPEVLNVLKEERKGGPYGWKGKGKCQKEDADKGQVSETLLKGY